MIYKYILYIMHGNAYLNNFFRGAKIENSKLISYFIFEIF